MHAILQCSVAVLALVFLGMICAGVWGVHAYVLLAMTVGLGASYVLVMSELEDSPPPPTLAELAAAGAAQSGQGKKAV